MNVFLFFYLFLLFILLTPGTIITLSIMKQSPYSKWIVAAIHGFLFSAIAITTYSFVNDLYISVISPIQDPFADVDSGYIYTSSDGDKEFNTLSTTPPGKPNTASTNGPNIRCGHIDGGKYKFCGSADQDTQRVYCYGSAGTCTWNTDCNTDSDCKIKYNENSPKYTDANINASQICANYPANTWPAVFCKLQGIPTKA